MLFLLIGAIGLYYSWYSWQKMDPQVEEVVGIKKYKNPFYPEEGATYERHQSSIPFDKLGKRSPHNAVPYVTVKDGRDRLMETQWGFTPLPEGHNQQKQIDYIYNLSVHDKLDPWRAGPTRRQPYRQNSFYYSD